MYLQLKIFIVDWTVSVTAFACLVCLVGAVLKQPMRQQVDLHIGIECLEARTHCVHVFVHDNMWKFRSRTTCCNNQLLTAEKK